MTSGTQAMAVKDLVESILANDPGYFLVEVKVQPGNNIKVSLDGDQGISIEKCVSYNRSLYRKLEESGIFPNDDFSLEVSSPGLDEPLKLLRQFKNNIGRKVEILLKSGMKVEAKLTNVFNEAIVVEETKGKNKKKEVLLHTFPFEEIKSTKIQTVF